MQSTSGSIRACVIKVYVPLLFYILSGSWAQKGETLVGIRGRCRPHYHSKLTGTLEGDDILKQLPEALVLILFVNGQSRHYFVPQHLS